MVRAGGGAKLFTATLLEKFPYQFMSDSMETRNKKVYSLILFLLKIFSFGIKVKIQSSILIIILVRIISNLINLDDFKVLCLKKSFTNFKNTTVEVI